MKLLLATGNQGKVREFRQILGTSQFDYSDLSQHPKIESPDETGKTFRANACLKATFYATNLSTWALADDSGLEVDALDGSPGVLSARWAEIHHAGKGDADNNKLLLDQLQKCPDAKLTARFVCVLALSDPQGKIVLTTRETVEGRIVREARGANGFGYDPLFLVEEFGKTTAELEAAQKHQISHRGKALRRLQKLMAGVDLGKSHP